MKGYWYVFGINGKRRAISIQPLRIKHKHMKLYSNVIHQNKKAIKHNMILRTWSKGQKAWDNHALKKVSTNTETYPTNKQKTHITNKQKYTRHAPKWNQLYSDSKTDFSWFRKCLVVLQCLTVLSKEFQKEGPQ